jgi:hypothetical protein
MSDRRSSKCYLIVQFIITSGILFDIFYFTFISIGEGLKNNIIYLLLILMIKLSISMLVISSSSKIARIISLFTKVIVEVGVLAYSICFYTNNIFYISAISIEVFVLLNILIYFYYFNIWSVFNKLIYDCETHSEICDNCLCPICLDSYNDKVIYELGCTHKFHKECLDIWLNKKRHCPVCRIVIIIS